MAKTERFYAFHASLVHQLRLTIDYLSTQLTCVSLGPELISQDYLDGMNDFRRKLALQEFRTIEERVKEFVEHLKRSAERLRSELIYVRQELTTR